MAKAIDLLVRLRSRGVFLDSRFGVLVGAGMRLLGFGFVAGRLFFRCAGGCGFLAARGHGCALRAAGVLRATFRCLGHSFRLGSFLGCSFRFFSLGHECEEADQGHQGEDLFHCLCLLLDKYNG